MKKSLQTIELIICRPTNATKPDAGKQVRDSNKKCPSIKELHQSINRDTLAVLDANMVNNYSQFFIELS